MRFRVCIPPLSLKNAKKEESRVLTSVPKLCIIIYSMIYSRNLCFSYRIRIKTKNKHREV